MKQGEFLGSRLFGPGKCNYANGDEYIGKFNEGFKHGFGTMKYRTIESTEAPEAIMDQAVYEGNWKHDLKHGEGTMKWADMSSFTGQWKEDKRFKGKMKLKDGTVYDGYFEHENFHGKGTLKLPMQPFEFTGVFVEGKCPKKGKVKDINTGDQYTGELFDFELHGEGEMKYKDGRVWKGTFYHGAVTGKGMMQWPNGDFYQGYMNDGLRHGHGFMFYNDKKMIWEGEWAQDQWGGDGKQIQADGAVKVGSWKEGILQGAGVREGGKYEKAELE